MELKDIASYQKSLDKLDLENPPVLMVSGTDPGAAERLTERLRGRLRKEVGQYETLIFSGEQGDDERFLEEIANVPLFSPYRLILIRQAEELFKGALQSKAQQSAFEQAFSQAAARTLVFLVYEGSPPQKLVKILHGADKERDGLLHLVTRDLFSNQILDQIRHAAKRSQLNLSEEAVHLMREHLEPRAGVIERTLQRLNDMLSEQQRANVIGVDEVREVLFPGQGANSFALVDALFALDQPTVQRELVRWNPNHDSFFSVLKLMLMRADEIRKARIGIGMSMNDAELIDFLGLKSRHPYVQKKVLSRVKMEVNTFTPQRLTDIYEFLIQIQHDFRSNVSVHRHNLIFQERISRVFFQTTH